MVVVWSGLLKVGGYLAIMGFHPPPPPPLLAFYVSPTGHLVVKNKPLVVVDQGHFGTEDPHEEHSELLTQAVLCWYGRGKRGQVWEGEEGGRYGRGRRQI